MKKGWLLVWSVLAAFSVEWVRYLLCLCEWGAVERTGFKLLHGVYCFGFCLNVSLLRGFVSFPSSFLQGIEATFNRALANHQMHLRSAEEVERKLCPDEV